MSGSATDGGYTALREGAAAHILARDALTVAGPDAVAYLQGQCSQDVEGLEEGRSTEALLLSPQGKLDAWVRVTRTGEDAFVLDTDAGMGELAIGRLERFRLRMRVAVAPLAWACVAVRGPGAAGVVAGGAAVVAPVDWPGFTGVDLLGPPPAGGPTAWVVAGTEWCDGAAWEAARIEAGVPASGRELGPSTIPAETDLVARAVSFTKGCYTGQELVARIDARGSHVARRLCGVVVDDGDDPAGAPPVGAVVRTRDGATEVGTLTSVARSPGFGATVALATLHRRVSPPEGVTVVWTDAAGATRRATAEARPLPLVG